jgi:hypothetical protein
MYPLVKVPTFADKSFFDFTRPEAKEYLQWFLAIKPERLKILENRIQQAYPEWKLDYTRASFYKFYEWFKGQIANRPINEEEKQKVKEQLNTTPLLAEVIQVPQSTFTDQTVTVCFDAGIYIGESLIFNLPELKWTQKINATNYIYYAQPVIAKKGGKVPLNPRAATEGIARRILDNDIKQITFVELFDKSIENLAGSDKSRIN